MIHTDTDIAEILERFKEQFINPNKFDSSSQWREEVKGMQVRLLEDFIARECLALKKKWEREHFDNQ